MSKRNECQDYLTARDSSIRIYACVCVSMYLTVFVHSNQTFKPNCVVFMLFDVKRRNRKQKIINRELILKKDCLFV